MKDVWTRAITNLRSTHGFSFAAGKTKNEAGLHHVALRTVRNYVNKSGYYFWQLRRKGQVTAKDRKKQIIYAKEKLRWTSDFWLKYMSFSYVSVCFVHKLYPMDEIRTSGSRIYQKKAKDCA